MMLRSAIIWERRKRLRAWGRNHTLRLRSTPTQEPPFSLTEEFHLDSPEGNDREHYLARLLARHWHACGSTEPWDLEYRGTRVLMATEHGHGTAKRTLVRVSGPASVHDIRKLLEE